MSAIGVRSFIGKGISAHTFIEAMSNNKENFQDWYNKFEWQSEDDLAFFQSFQFRDDIRCLILAADWCGDVIRNVPVVLRALEETEIPIEVMVVEQFPELMDMFLTMGGKAIPIVIFSDTGGAVLAQWGPRPKPVQDVMVAFKATSPDREAADYQEKIAVVRKEMMNMYGEDTTYQQWIVQELRATLAGV